MCCELPSVFSASKPKANKPHKCCECGGQIQPGETYHKFWGVWNGEQATYKVCSDCHALRIEVDKDEHDPEMKTGFTALVDSVCDISDNGKMLVRFIEIKRKRGAVIPEWMQKRVNS